MKVYDINANDNRMAEILKEADIIANDLWLSDVDKMSLKLMTEEAIELVNVIIKQYSGSFCYKVSDRTVSIVIQAAKYNMSLEEKLQLLSASTTGTNEAYKGFKGAILSLFDNGYKLSNGITQDEIDDLANDICAHSEFTEDGGMYVFNNNTDLGVRHIGVVEGMEQSILAKVADKIEVGVINKMATITISKSF